MKLGDIVRKLNGELLCLSTQELVDKYNSGELEKEFKKELKYIIYDLNEDHENSR